MGSVGARWEHGLVQEIIVLGVGIHRELTHRPPSAYCVEKLSGKVADFRGIG
jgi:hypothetical protein